MRDRWCRCLASGPRWKSGLGDRRSVSCGQGLFACHQIQGNREAFAVALSSRHGSDFREPRCASCHRRQSGDRSGGRAGHGVALCIGGARSSRALSKPGRVDAEPPAATRIGSRTRPPRAPARISWRPRSRLAPGREIEPKRRWLKGNSAETGVTSLSPGRAIVVLRRMKTGAIGHGVPVTPDERALSSWSFLTKSFSSVPFTRLFRSSVPSCCPTR